MEKEFSTNTGKNMQDEANSQSHDKKWIFINDRCISWTVTENSNTIFFIIQSPEKKKTGHWTVTVKSNTMHFIIRDLVGSTKRKISMRMLVTSCNHHDQSACPIFVHFSFFPYFGYRILVTGFKATRQVWIFIFGLRTDWKPAFSFLFFLSLLGFLSQHTWNNEIFR